MDNNTVMGMLVGIIITLLICFVIIFGLQGPKLHWIEAPNWINEIQCREGQINFKIHTEDDELVWSRTSHRCNEK